MRCMDRNKTPFYYALYDSKEEIIDDYGNKTGQYKIVYGKPTSCSANISAARGEIQSRQFGEGEAYDKVIVLENPNTPIDEYSILWIDSVPTLDVNGSLVLTADDTVETPHDYIVKKVARSLNCVSIAVSKVNVR